MTMIHYVPIRVLVFDDLVAFFVPKAKEVVGDMLALMNAGHYDEQSSKWHIYTFEGDRYALVLEVQQGTLSLALMLPPQMWELLPAISKAKTVGLITDRAYWDDEKNEVTGIALGQGSELLHTMLNVYNVHKGLYTLPEKLKDIQPTWNPKGVVTYLLNILGEPVEKVAQ